jgi:hypothetical protein
MVRRWVGEPSSYLVRFGSDGTTDPAFGAGGKLSVTPDPIAEGVAERSLSVSNFIVDGMGRLLMFGRQSDARHTYPNPNTSEGQTAIESEAVVLRFDRGERLIRFHAGSGSSVATRSSASWSLRAALLHLGRHGDLHRPADL